MVQSIVSKGSNIAEDIPIRRADSKVGLASVLVKGQVIYHSCHKVVYNQHPAFVLLNGSFKNLKQGITSEALSIIEMVKEFKKEKGVPAKGFLFSEYDKPLSIRSVEAYYTKYCNELGTVHKSCHCARRTYATALHDSGVNIKTIMEQMGHKDAKTTYSSYILDRSGDDAKRKQIETALSF